MRGAPQVGFSATIRKIKARTSLLTRFRPPTWLTLETHVQYKRNPARCQFTTVLGVTKMGGLVHPDQNVRNATQNRLCRAVNRQVLEDEVLPGTENADQTTEEMSERHDHSRNYIAKVRIELCAKSFILPVYDVLARQCVQER